MPGFRCILLVVFATVLLPVASAEDVTASAARVAASQGVPHLVVPSLDQAPGMDAVPDFRGWAGPLPLARLDGAAGTPPPLTQGHVGRHGNSLFLAVRCADPAAAGIVRTPVAADGDVWTGDSVEFMLLPSYDFRQPYYHVAVNPAGSLYDAKGQDKAWNSGARVFTAVDEAGWVAVVEVPMASMGVSGQAVPGLWRINLHRGRATAPALDLAWSPTLATFSHVPKRFGVAALPGGQTVAADLIDAWLGDLAAAEILYRQDFEQDSTGLVGGTIATGIGPNGRARYLRADGKVRLNLAIADTQQVKMAVSYRCNADQHGVVISGSGKPMSPTRPGLVSVFGRGLKAAQSCVIGDSDGAGKTESAGLDGFRFKRRYGHCQQSNMPPTPGEDWAVASFEVDNMYSNDSHTRAPATQSYNGFGLGLNGTAGKTPFLELGWVVLWRGKDSVAPSVPGDFLAASEGERVSFRWQAAQDNLMVAYYELLRREGETWTVATLSTMTTLALPAAELPAGDYALRAVDVDDNRSAVSAVVRLPTGVGPGAEKTP